MCGLKVARGGLPLWGIILFLDKHHSGIRVVEENPSHLVTCLRRLGNHGLFNMDLLLLLLLCEIANVAPCGSFQGPCMSPRRSLAFVVSLGV